MADRTNVLYPNLHGTYKRAARAEGCYVYDEDGTGYLDGCSGAIVVNVGHRNPEILDAMREQLNRITYCYRTQFSNEPAERLASKLTALAPEGLRYVQYTNSGSEGTEAAVRLALQFWQESGHPERDVVISRDVSYHGATLGSLAMSGHETRRRTLLPLMPHVPRIPAANCHRCPFGMTRGTCDLQCASALEDTIRSVGPDRVAAFIFEPVVGAAGGAIPAPPGYLRAIAEICARYDVLMISDEVMTGLGRTGHWFGCDAGPVAPDLLVLGKGMSAGYVPIGAVLISERVHEAMRAGSGGTALGHTYSANPLAAATAEAVVDFLVREDIPARAAAVGAKLRRRLTDALAVRGLVADVRGAGLLLGVDFAPRPSGPDHGITAAAVVGAAYEAGLLLYPAGTDDVPRAVIVAPPLTIGARDLDRLVELFEHTLDQVLAGISSRGGADDETRLDAPAEGAVAPLRAVGATAGSAA